MVNENQMPPINTIPQPTNSAPFEIPPKQPLNKIYILIGFIAGVIVVSGILLIFLTLKRIGQTGSIESFIFTPTPTLTPIPSSTPTPTPKELLIPVTTGNCGVMESVSVRNADYSLFFNNPCNLDLIQQKDGNYLELTNTISAGPNLSEGIILNFNIPEDIDPKQILSSKIILQNVNCSGSVVIRYTSKTEYNNLAFYGATEGDPAFNCGTGVPKNFKQIELNADIIDGKTSAVIVPYTAYYPMQIDKIYLDILYNQQ